MPEEKKPLTNDGGCVQNAVGDDGFRLQSSPHNINRDDIVLNSKIILQVLDNCLYDRVAIALRTGEEADLKRAQGVAWCVKEVNAIVNTPPRKTPGKR